MIDSTSRGPIPEIEEAGPCEGEIIFGVGDERPSLRTVVLVYEDREAWIARAARRTSLSHRAAELASHWLLDLDNIKRIHGDLNDLVKRKGVSVERYELDDFLLHHFQSYMDERTRSSTLLWNITDGVLGFRGSHLISLAELYDIPYFGCPPFAHQLAQDKFKLYSLCHSLGIKVPACELIENGEKVAACSVLPGEGTYFVKPNSLGNKVGIGRRSLCKTRAQAEHRAMKLQSVLRDRAVVQSFIDGPEVRVMYMDAAKDGAARYGFDVVDEHLEGGHFVASCERERKYTRFVDFHKWGEYAENQRERALREMEKAVRLLEQHVRVKDYYTVDFRLDAEGCPFLLDFNPGAFLYGDEVEEYMNLAFDLKLPEALFSAMVRSHSGQCGDGQHVPEIAFRV